LKFLFLGIYEELRVLLFIPWSWRKHKQTALPAKQTCDPHRQTNHPSQEKHPNFTRREFMSGLLGAGVGALINHISSSRYIWFFVWIALSLWAGFHFWPMGGSWRRCFVVSCIVLLFVSVTLFLFESPKHPHLNLSLHFNGSSLDLTNEYFNLRKGVGTFELSDNDIKGFVVVPVLAGATNADIRLGLRETSDAIIEHIVMKLVCPTNVHFIYDTNVWFECEDNVPGHSAFSNSRDFLIYQSLRRMAANIRWNLK